MMSFFFLESVEIDYTLVRTPMDVLLLSASLQKQCSCLHICIFMFLGGLCKNLGGCWFTILRISVSLCTP
jgi:hypothetical protein